MARANPVGVVLQSKALQALSKAGKGTPNLAPVLPEIAAIIQASIDYNFQVGGRYGDGEYGGGDNRWVPSKRAQEQAGLTLVDNGILRASVQVTYGESDVTISSNDEGFTTHHFGDVREAWGGPQIAVYPRRSIAVIQGEDLEDITEVTIDNIAKILNLE